MVLLSPFKPVGGLEISDTDLRFLELIDDKPIYASLRLPPGIIELGKIKDRANFIEALRSLHGQIVSDPKKTIDAIVTIPASDAYVQAVQITKVSESNLAETADLNLRMVSPIDVNTSYYAWQNIVDDSNNAADKNQIEILGAFISKNTVDDFTGAIKEAGYGIAAVEFSTLSLTRSVFSSGLLKYDAPYLVVRINPGGIYFIILRNHSLVFNYFASWGVAQGEERAISLDNAKDLVTMEAQRILNFYSSHWGGQIKNVAIITSILGEELGGAVKSRFPDVEVEIIRSDAATAVQGAAIRGLVPRINDFDISLTSVSVHETFHAEQTLKFLSLWQSITITVFAGLLLLFVISDISVRNIAAGISSTSKNNVKQADMSEYTSLKAQADDFNKLVKLVASAKLGERKTAWLIDKIGQGVADTGVSIDRIYVQSSDAPVIVVAEAADQQSAVDFKNKLENIKQLSKVDFPLSGITIKSDSLVAFTITFNVISWIP